MGIEVGLVVLVLAALGLFSMLAYAAESALCLRNGYTRIALQRNIEDLRAQDALLRYQINLSESSHRVEQVAERLHLRPADPAHDVDFVVLPSSVRDRVQLATNDPRQVTSGISGVVAALATEMVGSAESHAEASTGESHRP